MNYGEDEWFTFDNNDEFNEPAESPGAAGQYFEPGNIDNIPLNDDAADPLDFNNLDEYQYNDQLRFSPNGGDNVNGHNGQQVGTSGGQYQSMHLMQNTDTFDQHMPSTSMEYNSFEMPIVVTSSNHENGPFQDIVMDDPNSFYGNQQPSTSMGNKMGMNDGYDMMGQQSSSYMPQIDQMAGPSSVGNQQPGPSHQQEVEVPPAQKPKPKKSRPSGKKKQGSGPMTVGTVLTEVHKMRSTNGEVVEAQFTAEESQRLATLLHEISRLQEEISQGHDRSDLLNVLQAELVELMARNVGSSSIMTALQGSLTPAIAPSAPTPAPAPPPPAAKRPPPKRNRNSQPSKNIAQQSQQQAEMTPTKIVMEPPTTTMVPSSSHSNNNYSTGNENYAAYQPMDQPGPSQQQPQYAEYQQPEPQDSMHHQGQNQMQPGQTKVVPTMEQRTHSYRQSVFFNPQSNNGPGPSPQMQPHSHESHHMDQVHDIQQHQFHQQDDEGSQMYAPRQQHDQLQQHQQDDRHMFQQPLQDPEMERSQSRFQTPQDTPNLRHQLQTNVNAKQNILGSQVPTPSPGNMQFAEPMQDSYQQSQEQHIPEEPQEYDENFGEYFATPTQQQGDSQMDQMQANSEIQYDQQDMYQEMEDREVGYHEMPEVTVELSQEELEAKMEENRQYRSRKVKEMMLEQLAQLEKPVDLTPFRGRKDVFNRMLPYHHFTAGEEPVPEFVATADRYMSDLVLKARALGNQIRNVVLRDTMRSTTEWEENMLLYLETESERRQLVEDRETAEQDCASFVQSSEIINLVSRNMMDLESVKRAAPPRPVHLQDVDEANGQLTVLYKEYEFDSYDENRPRGSPVPYQYVYEEPESESEPEPEPEVEPEPEPIRSDLSPLTDFPALSPLPSDSPARSRNDSETSCEWKDEEDESPLLSPESDKYAKAADQLHREMFGDDDELDRSTDLFPFARLLEEDEEEENDRPRRNQQSVSQSRVGESVDSSAESSSSTASSPRKVARSPSPASSTSSGRGPVREAESSRSPSPVFRQTGTSKAAISPSPAHNYNRESSASPEIDDTFFSPPKRVNAADIPPIPLPVPLHMIKLEKEETPKLSFKVPLAVFKRGIELAATDDDDIQEIPIRTPAREPIKLKIKLRNIKLEVSTPEREPERTSVPIVANAVTKAVKVESPQNIAEQPVEEPSPIKPPVVFKTPTPVKVTPTSENRKRRSAKIDDSPKQKKAKNETPKKESLMKQAQFTTPKNGMIEEERFLRTMTDGRKITLRIGKMPRNINHFVTPRRDGKGRMMKDLTPNKYTRLKMTLRRKNGRLSVEFTENKKVDEPLLDQKNAEVEKSPKATPSTSKPSPPKPRLAPASRKSSIDASGKDKKNHITKNKSAFCNKFNPFANVPSSSSSGPSSSSTPSGPSASLKLFTSSASRPISKTTPLARPTAPSMSAVARGPSFPRTPVPQVCRPAPVVPPKILVTKVPPASSPKKEVEQPKKAPALIPWMTESDDLAERKPKNTTLLAPPSTTTTTTSTASSSSGPSTSSIAKVKVEPVDPTEAAPTVQDSPRASSSLSIFFEDDKLPFLSPKRANEPLPVVEFSDDEENDLAHSTFSHATDHLLSTSNLSNPVNGAPPFLPWSTDP